MSMTREGSVSLNTRLWAVACVGVFPSAGVPAGFFNTRTPTRRAREEQGTVAPDPAAGLNFTLPP